MRSSHLLRFLSKDKIPLSVVPPMKDEVVFSNVPPPCYAMDNVEGANKKDINATDPSLVLLLSS